MFEEVIANSVFSLDEYEIAQYSTYLISEQEKYASVYELDLNSYITQMLNMTVEEFYEKYYDYGEYEIKKFLIVGAIFNDLNYIIDDEEYLIACEKMQYNYTDAKNDNYIDALINYHIMEEKVIDFFLNNVR
ncbi:MAG: hypothetical protein E7261_01375 [Lachnospiraceae bacterium]|nr:hypothetical protein [Lachnospiraceae bacterium]